MKMTTQQTIEACCVVFLVCWHRLNYLAFGEISEEYHNELYIDFSWVGHRAPT